MNPESGVYRGKNVGEGGPRSACQSWNGGNKSLAASSWADLETGEGQMAASGTFLSGVQARTTSNIQKDNSSIFWEPVLDISEPQL